MHTHTHTYSKEEEEEEEEEREGEDGWILIEMGRSEREEEMRERG
jgi:hypothetical protein